MIVATTVADTIKDVGTLAGAVAMIAAFWALVFKLRPVKYVARHLVTEPFGQWIRHIIRDEVEESMTDIKFQFKNNGGSTMMDMVQKAALNAELALTNQGVMEERLDGIERAVTTLITQEDNPDDGHDSGLN